MAQDLKDRLEKKKSNPTNVSSKNIGASKNAKFYDEGNFEKFEMSSSLSMSGASDSESAEENINSIHLPELLSHQRGNKFHESDKEKGSRLSKRKLDSHDDDGKRTKYFKDDDVSLAELVKREKHGLDDYDKNYFENVAGNKRYKEHREAQDLDFADELVDFLSYEAKDKSRSKENLEEKHKARALSDYRTLVKKQKDCYYCFENKKVPKHLIISIGEHVQLILPLRPLNPGHCIITTLEHHTSGCPTMEREVWGEVQRFQSSIHQMNAKAGCATIFIETNLIGKHSFIEAFRIKPEAAGESQAYFMKAIIEAESEWAVHKKVITTSEQRGIRHSVPINFAYFHVQFGLSTGYAHIIEKESNFQETFGHEVIAGLLDIDDRFTQGKVKRQSLEAEQEEVKRFLANWLPFDWTTELDGGDMY
jgi:hypothetical protein